MAISIGAVALGLERVGPHVLLRHYPPACCIAAAPIAVAVFEHFGFKGAVAPAGLLILDSIRLQLWSQLGRQPTPTEAKAAGARKQLAVGAQGPLPQPGHWGGHLVAIIENRLLVDLSISQASAPEVGFTPPLSLTTFVDQSWFEQTSSSNVQLDDTWYALYSYRPELKNTWQAGSMWSDVAKRNMVISEIISTLTDA